MDGSPHLTMDYRLNVKSQMQMQEGWTPPISLGVRGMGMAECKRLALVTLLGL